MKCYAVVSSRPLAGVSRYTPLRAPWLRHCCEAARADALHTAAREAMESNRRMEKALGVGLERMQSAQSVEMLSSELASMHVDPGKLGRAGLHLDIFPSEPGHHRRQGIVDKLVYEYTTNCIVCILY